MKEHDFKQSIADPCIFIKEMSHAPNIREVGIIAVYVDDLMIVAPNQHAGLSKTFKRKDMASLHYCLGINV